MVVATDFHCICMSTMEVNGYQPLFGHMLVTLHSNPFIGNSIFFFSET